MKIAPMEPADVESVLGLWVENWEEGGESSPTHDDRARIRRVLGGYVSNGKVCCYLAKHGVRPVGFVTGSVSSHPVMEGVAGQVEELYVKPEYRGQGVGSDLVGTAVSFLENLDARVFKTHTCMDDKAAKSFCSSLGWEEDVATYSLYKPLVAG